MNRFSFKVLDDDSTDERGLLKDGHIMRTSMMMRDSLSPMQKAIAAAHDATQYDASTFDAASHRPGYRRASGTNDAAAKRAMYDTIDRELSDAWRSKAPPAGSYPAASGAKVGDSCTVNGSPGTLQRIDGADGYLECVATDDTDHSKDSRTYDAVNAEKIKAASYAAYDADL